MQNFSRRSLLAAAIAAGAAGISGCTSAAGGAAGTNGMTASQGAAASAAASKTAPSKTVASKTASSAGASTSAKPTPATSTPAASTATSPAASTAPSPAASTAPSPAASTSVVPRTSPAASSAAPRSIKPLGPATQYSSGPTSTSRVALTFHGQGDLGIARQILKITAAKKVHITVMVVGTWLQQYPTIAREILDGGHELGNHTWSHVRIQSLPEAQMLQEVVRCRDILLRRAGTPGDYFRASKTQYMTDQMRRVAGQAGYRSCLSYDVDSLDYTEPGAAAVRANVRSANAGSIVSLHFGYHSTVAALPGLIDDLSGRGLTAVTAKTLLGAGTV